MVRRVIPWVWFVVLVGPGLWFMYNENSNGWQLGLGLFLCVIGGLNLRYMFASKRTLKDVMPE